MSEKSKCEMCGITKDLVRVIFGDLGESIACMEHSGEVRNRVRERCEKIESENDERIWREHLAEFEKEKKESLRELKE